MQLEMPPRVCLGCGAENLPLASKCAACGSGLTVAPTQGSSPSGEGTVPAANHRSDTSPVTPSEPPEPTVSDAISRLDAWVNNDPRVFPAAIGIAVCLVILIFVGVPAGTVLLFMLVGGAFGAVVGWYRVYGQHSVAWAEPPKTEPVPPIPSIPSETRAAPTASARAQHRKPRRCPSRSPPARHRKPEYGKRPRHRVR